MKVVNIRIKSLISDTFHDIEAYSVPNICAPLSGQVIENAKNHRHLRNLTLADSNLGIAKPPRFSCDINIHRVTLTSQQRQIRVLVTLTSTL